MKKLLFIAIAIIGFSTISFGQTGASATAKTSATVITPISITKSVYLDFGTLAVNSTNGGTVVLVPAGTRTPTGGVTLPNISGSPAAAKFTVSGQASSTYAITLPTSSITLTDGSGHSMSVGTFTSTPSGTGNTGTGSEDVLVGATLTVQPGQVAGLYTNNSDLVVKVDYN